MSLVFFFFFCFCERQLKDSTGGMAVQFLVIFFSVIYADGVERRRKLNDYEMHTLANESLK